MKITVNSLAKSANVPPVVANGVLRFMEARGHAKVIGKMDADIKRKGRRASVYELNDSVASTIGL